MGRWEPDACARLRVAALELYGEQGFERTTVAEIAQRAGLTERTFFRYFADKREVLFDGTETLAGLMVDAVRAAPDSAPPLDAVLAGVGTVARDFFGDRYAYAARRQAVIDADTSLQERELIKFAALTSALTEALRGRGVPDVAARVAAEAGVLVFRVAFERWISSDGTTPLAQQATRVAAELRAVTAG